MSEEHPPFYGKMVNRREEAEYIEEILSEYKDCPVDEELKKKVWDRLCWEKHLGAITIPFSVSIKVDPDNLYPPVVEVLLDTKV